MLRRMAVDPELRTLDIDIPSKPEALVRLSLLLADEDVNLGAVGDLIESDMALAAAVMRAVNSALYGLGGRVRSVHQAVGYLGTSEVSGITFELGLRAAFPPAPDLEPIWDRAGQRGLLMGRLGQAMGLDAWAAHSAGLFEECGKAVLYRHAPEHYAPMLRAAGNDVDLCIFEHTGFGVSHDALGAALCESWGLGSAAVACVRHHVAAQAAAAVDGPIEQRHILALSLIARAMLGKPDQLDECIQAVAPQAELDTTLVLRAARRLQDQLDQARTPR